MLNKKSVLLVLGLVAVVVLLVISAKVTAPIQLPTIIVRQTQDCAPFLGVYGGAKDPSVAATASAQFKACLNARPTQ